VLIAGYKADEDVGGGGGGGYARLPAACAFSSAQTQLQPCIDPLQHDNTQRGANNAVADSKRSRQSRRAVGVGARAAVTPLTVELLFWGNSTVWRCARAQARASLNGRFEELRRGSALEDSEH